MTMQQPVKGANIFDKLETVVTRHRNICQEQIGLKFRKNVQGFGCVSGLTHDFQVRLLIN